MGRVLQAKPKGYKAYLISTIVDPLPQFIHTKNGYKAYLISTIVDFDGQENYDFMAIKPI